LPPYIRLSHLYGGRLKVSFQPVLRFLSSSRYIPPRSDYFAPRHPSSSGPSPVHTALLCSMARTSPLASTTTECPLSFRWFCCLLGASSPGLAGALPLFGIVSTFGPLGIPSGVGPRGTHRSHYHPSKGFPCPLPWTLQRGLGGGSLIPYAAHCGTQPGNGVASRLTRFSRLNPRLPAGQLGPFLGYA
jgi:hypothetical protein